MCVYVYRVDLKFKFNWHPVLLFAKSGGPICRL